MLPFQGRDVANRLLVGCLINFIPMVGQIFLCGYILRYTRKILRGGDADLPPWDEWGRLFVEGSWASVVVSAFILVPFTVLLVMAAPAFVAVLSAISEGHSDAAVDIFLRLVLGFAIGLLVLLACSLPAPIALCRFAVTDRVGDALNPAVWGGLIARAPLAFLGNWLGVFGSAVIVTMGLAMLNIIPVIGTLAFFVGSAVIGVAWGLCTQIVFARFVARHAR